MNDKILEMFFDTERWRYAIEKAVELAVEHSKKHNSRLWESDIRELQINKQTYGLDNNYMISSAITDTLDI